MPHPFDSRTLRLTLGIYTHARQEALGAAVERLVIPGSVGEVNPLAHLSRAELEGAVLGLLAMLRHFIEPGYTPDTPTRDTPNGRK